MGRRGLVCLFVFNNKLSAPRDRGSNPRGGNMYIKSMFCIIQKKLLKKARHSNYRTFSIKKYFSYSKYGRSNRKIFRRSRKSKIASIVNTIKWSESNCLQFGSKFSNFSTGIVKFVFRVVKIVEKEPIILDFKACTLSNG